MNKNNHNEEYKELRIRDIILYIQSYISYLIPKWKWIVLAGIIFGAFKGLNAYLTPAIYRENLTFMMDESKKKGGFNPADILGGIFGASNGGGDNLGKILQLFESKKIIHNTLFDTIEVNGKSDYIANHYLDFYTISGLVKDYKWPFVPVYKISWPRKLLDYQDFRFTNNHLDNFSNRENQFLRILYEKINGNPQADITPALNSKLNEETGIMSINMATQSESLTLGVLNNIYKQLSGFFIEKSVEKQKKTYKIMEFKRDSVLGELKGAEYALADFKDRNRKLVTVKGYLSQIRLERQAAILNVMYAEVVKQLEATDFALRNMTPVVQVIDLPRSPIVPSIVPWKRAFAIAFVIGAILAIIFFVLKKMWNDIMEE